MISSVRPSLKYSCSGSELRFAKGSTAIDAPTSRDVADLFERGFQFGRRLIAVCGRLFETPPHHSGQCRRPVERRWIVAEDRGQGFRCSKGHRRRAVPTASRRALRQS